MRSGITSAFSDPSGYHMAMRDEGFIDLAVTHNGWFQAGLIQDAWDRLRLSATKESLLRIAFSKTTKDRFLRRRWQGLMDCFNRQLATGLLSQARIASVSKAFGVSDRSLRRCCEEQLGVNSTRYLKLRPLPLRLVRRNLPVAPQRTAIRYASQTATLIGAIRPIVRIN